jgi:hypothetical protein
MQMMNAAGQNSIDMSLATANNIQRMAMANQGQYTAGWQALHTRSNINHMGEIRCLRDGRYVY